jgi:hypothetical protein
MSSQKGQGMSHTGAGWQRTLSSLEFDVVCVNLPLRERLYNNAVESPSFHFKQE